MVKSGTHFSMSFQYSVKIRPRSAVPDWLPFTADVKWQFVNSESRRSNSHRSGVCAAVRKAALSPKCKFDFCAAYVCSTKIGSGALFCMPHCSQKRGRSPKAQQRFFGQMIKLRTNCSFRYSCSNIGLVKTFTSCRPSNMHGELGCKCRPNTFTAHIRRKGHILAHN